MKNYLLAIAVACACLGSAAAEDWAGVSTIPATDSLSNTAAAGTTVCLNLVSVPVGPPPCAPDTYLYAPTTGSTLHNLPLPLGVSQAGSSANVQVWGTVADPTSPSGFTNLQVQVPLSAFARSDSVSALQNQVGAINTGLTALQGQVSGLASIASVSSLEVQINTLSTSLVSLGVRLSTMEAFPAVVNQIDQRVENIKRRSDENSVMAAALSPMTPPDGKTNRLGFNGAMTADQSAIALNYTHVSDNVDLSAGVAISGDSAMARAGVGISW